jgi:hypothetical protein
LEKHGSPIQKREEGGIQKIRSLLNADVNLFHYISFTTIGFSLASVKFLIHPGKRLECRNTIALTPIENVPIVINLIPKIT